MTPQKLPPCARACAGVVLYRPDPILLGRQAKGLQGVPLIAFSNGPVSKQAIDALAPTDLSLVASPDNVGLGRGLNAVMEAAAEGGFSHVMLLDQDSEPPPGLVDLLLHRWLALANQGEQAAVVAPLLTPPEVGFYKPIRYERRGVRRVDGLLSVEFAPTSGSLVSMAAYRDIGPFRDDFFIAGLDVEWGFRAWARGWGSYVSTDLTVPHRWGEAVSQEAAGRPQILRHTPLRNYYYARNVIAVAKLKHVPTRWRFKSCVGLAAQIGLVTLRGTRTSLSALWTGVIHGVRGRLGRAPAGLM